MKLVPVDPALQKIRENLFFSGLFGIIAVVIWITISVYNAYSNSKPDLEIESLLTPIKPVLDIEVLKNYKDSRVSPPEDFEIIATQKDKQKTTSTKINPFTGQTTQSSPPSSTNSAVEDELQSTPNSE